MNVQTIFKDRNIISLVKITLAVKLGIFLMIFLGFKLLPFCALCHQINGVAGVEKPINVFAAYQTWDAQHYLYLAENGYNPGQISNAFFPLLPFLVKIASGVTGGNFLLAGLVAANAVSLAAVIMFYQLVKERFTRIVAYRSSLLLLSFPTAFYLSLIYTEGIFLFLATLFFYSLYKNKLSLALVSGFLLPLAREAGILVLIPLLVFFYWRKNVKRKIGFGARERVAVVAATVAGFVFYLGVMKYFTGAYFPGAQLYSQFVSNYSLSYLFNPFGWFADNFLTIKLTIHGFTTSIIDRLFFVGLLFLLYKGYKKLDKTLLSFGLVLGLIAAMTGMFMSYSRFVFLLFPIYIVMALALKRKYYLAAIPSLVLQTFLLLVHSLGYWVA